MVLTGTLGWAYVRFGTVPTAEWLLYGVKPVMLAIVAQAIWGLSRTAAKTRPLRLLGALAVLLSALGVHELLVLLGAGATAVAASGAPRRWRTSLNALVPVFPATAVVGAAAPITLPSVFWVFFKTGSVLFGSGYVLLAFLRADLVERLHWLTAPQLIDAIAVGQVTPGPVFTTATFVGYVLSGPSGAAAATLGIFLPAFVFVALSGPLVPRLRASPAAGAFLDGVNVASLALMVVVTVELGRAALVDAPTALLAVIAAALLFGPKVSSTWVIVGGGAVGWLIHAGGR
jgi:chromate transporter